jgi:hypothetical protein
MATSLVPAGNDPLRLQKQNAKQPGRPRIVSSN